MALQHLCIRCPTFGSSAGTFAMAEYGWSVGNGSEDFFWRSCRDGEVGDGAVRGGVERDGQPLFVGRAIHEGDLLPAKISPSNRCAFVCWGGLEHQKLDYDVLCTSQQVVWKGASNGAIPDGAFPCGKTADGSPLFVGRVFHDGAMTIGKMHPGHSKCYIPYAGEEHAFEDYEVMVLAAS